MKFLDFKRLLTEILSEVKARDEYIQSVPQDIRSGIFDNTYVNSLNKTLDMLIKFIFGEHFEDVEWFLYEVILSRRAGGSSIYIGSTTYFITDLESYLNYAEKELNFD